MKKETFEYIIKNIEFHSYVFNEFDKELLEVIKKSENHLGALIDFSGNIMVMAPQNFWDNFKTRVELERIKNSEGLKSNDSNKAN